MVTNPVNVDLVLEKTANGFVLNALPYVENEEYLHEGDGLFFAKNGSSVRFEVDEENGLVKALVMDGNIRGNKEE